MSVGETMERSVDTTIDSLNSLSLSVTSGSASKYSFICLFLSRVLNIKDFNTILNDNNANVPHKKKRPVEILPGIAIPQDLWLYHEIIIKNVKIKTSLVHEINDMLVKHLQASTDSELDQSTLSFQKLLMAYKFLEMPERKTFYVDYTTSDLDLAFKEEDEEDDLEGNDSNSKSLSRTDSNETFDASHESLTIDSEDPTTSSTSLQSLNSHTTTLSNGHTNSLLSSKRISSLSRDLMSKKRFLSLLGNNGKNTSNFSETRSVSDSASYVSHASSITSGSIQEEDTKKHQALNGLLAKSRLYNKIKKHRELSGSMNSATSGHSSFSYSNRNSISTVSTNISSKRRASSSLATEFNDKASIKTASSIPFPKLTSHQIYANRKLKYEYYTELHTLNKLAHEMISLLSDAPSHSTIELLDFLQHYVLKLVVIDLSQMLIDYAHFKCHYLYAA